MPTDEALLQEYAATQDADAFAEIAARYADLVYTVCLRVTGNGHDAEDAAQECFLALARKACSIRFSLIGWLHATARRAASSRVSWPTHKETAPNRRPLVPNTWQHSRSIRSRPGRRPRLSRHGSQRRRGRRTP